MMTLNVGHSFAEAVTDALKKALELKMLFLTLDVKLAKSFENIKYDELTEYPNKT
jgi:hypothetical protein